MKMKAEKYQGSDISQQELEALQQKGNIVPHCDLNQVLPLAYLHQSPVVGVPHLEQTPACHVVILLLRNQVRVKDFNFLQGAVNDLSIDGFLDTPELLQHILMLFALLIVFFFSDRNKLTMFEGESGQEECVSLEIAGRRVIGCFGREIVLHHAITYLNFKERLGELTHSMTMRVVTFAQ